MKNYLLTILLVFPFWAVAQSPEVSLKHCEIFWNANPATEEVTHYLARWSADNGKTWKVGPKMAKAGLWQKCAAAGLGKLGAHRGPAKVAVRAVSVHGAGAWSTPFDFELTGVPSKSAGVEVENPEKRPK